MGKREQLLDAAVDCLATDGWGSTTTRRIVTAAGAHLPDVNYYFGSKQALLEEAAILATQRWAEGPIADLGSGTEDAGAELTATLSRFLAALDHDRSEAAAAVEAFAQAEHNERLRAELGAAYESFRVEVSTGVAKVADLPAGPESSAAATVLMALFDGLALQRLLSEDAFPDAEALVAALAALSTFLTGKPA